MVRIGQQTTAPQVSPTGTSTPSSDILAGKPELARGEAFAKVSKSLADLALSIEDRNATASAQTALNEIRAEGSRLFGTATDNAFLNKATSKLQVNDPDRIVESPGGDHEYIGENMDYEEFVMSKFNSFADKKLSSLHGLAADKIRGKVDTLKTNMSEDVLRASIKLQRAERDKVFNRQLEISKVSVLENPTLFNQLIDELGELDENMNLRHNVLEEGSKAGSNLAYQAGLGILNNNPHALKSLLEEKKGDRVDSFGEERNRFTDYLSAEQRSNLAAKVDNKIAYEGVVRQAEGTRLFESTIKSINTTGISDFEDSKALDEWLKTIYPGPKNEALRDSKALRHKVAVETFSSKERLKSMPWAARGDYIDSFKPEGPEDFRSGKSHIYDEMLAYQKKQAKLFNSDPATWADQVSPPEEGDPAKTLTEKVSHRQFVYEQTGSDPSKARVLTNEEAKSIAQTIKSANNADLLNVILGFRTQNDEFTGDAIGDVFAQKYSSAILKDVMKHGDLPSTYTVLIGLVNDGEIATATDLQRAMKHGDSLEGTGLDKDDIASFEDELEDTSLGVVDFSEYREAMLKIGIENRKGVADLKASIISLATLYRAEGTHSSDSEAVSEAVNKIIGSRVQDIDGEVIYPHKIEHEGMSVLINQDIVEDSMEALRENFQSDVMRSRELRKMGLDPEDIVDTNIGKFSAFQTYGSHSATMTDEAFKKSLNSGHWRSSSDPAFVEFVVPMPNLNTYLPLKNSRGHTIRYGLAALTRESTKLRLDDQTATDTQLRFNSAEEARKSKASTAEPE